MHSVKFLLDADMPRSSTELVKNCGYDIEDVRDIGMGMATDREIIQYALRFERCIITRDTDFGEVLRYPDHPGAIILRLPYTFSAEKINQRLHEFLEAVDDADIKHAILIVEQDRYRRRPL